MQELDSLTVSSSVIVVDVSSALTSSGDFLAPLAAGLSPPFPLELGMVGGRVPCDLRGVVAGEFVDKGRGEEGGFRCTLFKSVGVANQDVAAAAFIVARARELGIGTEVKM